MKRTKMKITNKPIPRKSINTSLTKNSIIVLIGGNAIIIAKFRRWLSKNKIWIRFRNNIQRQNMNTDLYHINDFCEFTWGKTPEGHDYWEGWSDKWKHFIDNPHVSNTGKKYVMKKKYRKKRKGGCYAKTLAKKIN